MGAGAVGQLAGELTFADLEKYTLEHGEPKLVSGRQEMLENLLNEYIIGE